MKARTQSQDSCIRLAACGRYISEKANQADAVAHDVGLCYISMCTIRTTLLYKEGPHHRTSWAMASCTKLKMNKTSCLSMHTKSSTHNGLCTQSTITWARLLSNWQNTPCFHIEALFVGLPHAKSFAWKRANVMNGLHEPRLVQRW